MKKTISTISILALALMLASCSKDNDEVATPADGGSSNPPASNTSSAPTFEDGFGTLWAVKSITIQQTPGLPFPIEMELGIGSAVFPTDAGATTFANAGTVTLNSTTLAKAPNNAYYSQVSVAEPTGIDFSSGVHWTVAGAGEIPAVDRNVTFPFPTMGEITSSTTVTRSNGYTLTVQNVSGCDSVVFVVGSVHKVKPAGSTSCSFSASELSGLAAGSSQALVAAYKYEDETIGGKKMYFGKEIARSKSITVQ